MVNFFAVMLFFSSYIITRNISFATLLLVIYSLIVLFLFKIIRIDKIVYFSLILIIIFGGLSLVLKDPFYIKLKPTIETFFIGTFLLAAQVIFKKYLITMIISKDMVLSARTIKYINIIWIIYFYIIGSINLYVSLNFSDYIWVNFKFFGIFLITFCLIILQYFVYHFYAKENNKRA